MRTFAILFALFGCRICLGQTITIAGKVVDGGQQAVPFANVVLFQAGDTLQMVRGTASDLSGRYAFERVAPGAYLLKASFVGYKTTSARLQAEKSRSCNLVLQRDSMSIGEVVVEGERSLRGIDKSSYLFSEAQIARAADGRELVASLPNLRIDRTTNALATVNGKKLLLLINGIKASDEDLRLIPADKIRKVELYDVPPIRYMNDAERVVNILTKPLDTGWSGNLYGTLGQMFSNASASLSYIRGDNRLSFHYGAHINMKRDVRNRETGSYAYRIGEENYLYDYLRESMKWGHQHNFGLTYTRSKEHRYDLQVKASAQTDNEWMEADKHIFFTQNTLQEERTGRLTDRTESIVPTLDLYFSKYFSPGNTLVLNLVGSYFDNSQRTRSTESGTTGFDDLMLLDNRKKTLIGEAAYLHSFSRAQLTVGYRSHCNFLSNELRNSVSERLQTEHITTQKHYLYAEISGKLHSWLYRASLGATGDIRSGADGFRNLTFTPVVMLGYAIDRANTLRIAYDSETLMPEMQQMSEARILLMSDFYQTGNAALKNAHRQSWRLSYDLQLRKFSLQAALFHEQTRNSLFDSYHAGDGCILLQTDNAKRDIRRGCELNLDYTPWEFLRIGCSAEAAQQLFQPSATSATCRRWTFPVTLYLSASYRSFSLDLYQKLGGTYLSGLYESGIEKASYISLGYTRRALRLALQCFFPFMRDRYSNRTIPASIVRHNTDYHLRAKDHALALSLSWSFGTGRKKAAVRQRVENYDNDSGLFRIK